jgi:hypothetical protein
VPDNVEQVSDTRGEILALPRGDLRSFRWRVFEPERGQEAHGPRDRQHLLVSGVLYAALPKISEVGAGHHAARDLVELLSRPGCAVRVVGIEEKLETLGYVQEMFLRISMFV